MKKIFQLAWIVLMFPLSVSAQTFSSGSTGADGALNVTTNTAIQLPPSGVLNYTTITVASGATLTFKNNYANTPAILLAQGAVNIAGSIEVGGYYNGRTPGPGGFFGGAPGQKGFGPAGGSTSGEISGKWVGPLSLVPLIGGSGGGSCSQCVGGAGTGGGGGGAILVASSSSVTVEGSLKANGAIGNNGGAGSGGAIRLIANSIHIASSAFLQATAGNNADGVHDGVIRLEAPVDSLSFLGTSRPAPILSSINAAVFPTTSSPSLKLVSIGGFPAPTTTAQRFDAADLLLPKTLTDPINVVVQGTNIPVGTSVNVNISGAGSPTAGSATLSGTIASSTATIAVSGLIRTAVSSIFVYATFSLPSSASALIADGPDKVASLRVNIGAGGASHLAFQRDDGSEITRDKVHPVLLRQLGQ